MMKNLFIILAVTVCSLSLFSCTADEINEDLTEEITTEEVAAGRERDVWADDEL